MNEILHYIQESVGWLCIGGALHMGSLGIPKLILAPFSQRILSQQNLDEVVFEESMKLGLNNKNIKGVFTQENDCAVRSGNQYFIELNNSYFHSRRSTVRHELYHILKDSNRKKKLPRLIDYLFIAEPRATLYGTFGIRL
jgi:hypothetical protein